MYYRLLDCVGEHVVFFVEELFSPKLFPRSFSTWLVRVLLLAHVRRYVADATAVIIQIALVHHATGNPVLHKRRVLGSDGICRSVALRIPIRLRLGYYAMFFRRKKIRRRPINW